MNIKPIETIYKGYQFRSRLEARWAVFFDQLAIKWQYEVEGFQLPSGWYLPDFYLPEQDCYVEIKPPHARPEAGASLPRVYMAGRMTEPCWRPFSVYSDYYVFDDTVPSPVAKTLEQTILYTGPFRTELANHSFLHGLDSAAYCHEPEVFKRSIAGIKACEVFFAYFSDLEAYGTLVEVGMAHALGKRIVVGFTDQDRPGDRWDIHNHGEDPASGSNDLWFAASCAEKVFAGSTEDVLVEFGAWLAMNYPVSREIIAAGELSAGKKSSVCIFYGDPVEAIVAPIWWRRYPLGGIPKPRLAAAALVARQARFEHGQSGARM